MKRNLASIIAVVLIGVVSVVGSQMLRPASAQESRTITVQAYTLTNTDAEDGAECLPWGLADTSLEVLPFRQVIVTDHHGDIVGAIDLEVGTYRTGDNDQQTCSIESTLQVADAPFYTFAVDGKYKRTVSRESLSDMDWKLFAHVR